jgi:hypothetical protein
MFNERAPAAAGCTLPFPERRTKAIRQREKFPPLILPAAGFFHPFGLDVAAAKLAAFFRSAAAGGLSKLYYVLNKSEPKRAKTSREFCIYIM